MNEIQNLLDENGTYSNLIDGYLYQDGIINKEIFEKEEFKILFVLRETNNRFNPIKWWNEKLYSNMDINPFDRNKINKGTKRPTWEPIARICYSIFNETKKIENDNELADCLKKIAIINLKKTPGKSKIGKEFHAYVKQPAIQQLIYEQIKRIDPNVIICGNTLNDISNELISYRKGVRRHLSEFTNGNNIMQNNSGFYFRNKLFLNPYHPSYVMDKNEYINVVLKSFNFWKENCMGNPEYPEFMF